MGSDLRNDRGGRPPVNDPVVLIAFVAIVLVLVGAFFKRIDWFAAIGLSLLILLLLALFGHWPQ